jgi:hypothetical protein
MSTGEKARNGIVFVSLLAAAGSAISASQGSLGTTSTATSVLTITIPETLRLSGLSDFAFGTYSGSGALSANADVCVYDNSSNGNYHVTATDSTSLTATAFAAQNGAAASIPFSVRWNNGTGTTGNYALTYNKSHAASGANTKSTDCSTGGKSANLNIQFVATDLAGKPGGAYTSTITVMVEP